MNGRIASDAYRPALLIEDVEAAVALDDLVDHPLDVRLVGDVGPDAAVGRVEVGDHDVGAVGGEARPRSRRRCPARRR